MGDGNSISSWFALMTMINFQLNMDNHKRNEEEVARQKRIEEKLDKLLEMLQDG